LICNTVHTLVVLLVAELSSTGYCAVCTGIVDAGLLASAEQLIVTGAVGNAFYTAIAVLETDLLWLARSQSSNAGTVGADLWLAELRAVTVRVADTIDAALRVLDADLPRTDLGTVCTGSIHTGLLTVAVETVAAVGISGTRNTDVLILEANLTVLTGRRAVCTDTAFAGLLAVAEEPVAAVGIDRALSTAVTVLEAYLAVLTRCHTICTNTACTGLITVAEELVLTICV
jgi:hypothetical protein